MADTSSHSSVSGKITASVNDLAAYLSREIPWLSEPVGKALNNIPTDHRWERVAELVAGIIPNLRGLQSELSKLYVRTADFEQLLGRALRSVAAERNKNKRTIYRAFLIDAITSPCEPYGNQAEFLRVLGEVRADHLRIVQALNALPDLSAYPVGSPVETLRNRLSDIPRNRLEGLLAQLNELGITELGDWQATQTDGNAERLSSTLTPLGLRLLRYLRTG